MSSSEVINQLTNYGYYLTLETLASSLNLQSTPQSRTQIELRLARKIIRLSPGDFAVSLNTTKFDSYLNAIKSGTPYNSDFTIPREYLQETPATNEDKVRYDVYKSNPQHVSKTEIMVSFLAGIYKRTGDLNLRTKIVSLDLLAKFVGMSNDVNLFWMTLNENFPYQDCSNGKYVRRVLAQAISHANFDLGRTILEKLGMDGELTRVMIYNCLSLADFSKLYSGYKNLVDGDDFYLHRSTSWDKDVVVNRKYHVLYKLVIGYQNFAAAYFLIESGGYPLDHLVYSMVYYESKRTITSPGSILLIQALDILMKQKNITPPQINEINNYRRQFLNLALAN